MRVEPDRVGALDTAQGLPALVGDRREASVGRVRVQPDVLRPAVVRHRPKWIDRPGAGSARVRADRDRPKPLRAVLSHGARERRHIETVVPVGLDLADAVRPDADDHRGTHLRTVALVAHVHGRASRIAGRFPGRNERVHAGGGATAGQQSTRALRIAEPLPKPIQDREFDLARTAGNQPGAGVHVPGGSQEVRDHAGPRRLRRNESEAAGVVQPGRHRENVLDGLPQDLFGRPTFLRRVLEQQSLEAFLELPVPGALAGQTLDPGHRELRRLFGQSQHGFLRHPEVGRA